MLCSRLPTRPPTRVGRRAAAATVELAVILPFLVSMALFACDFGRIFYYSITLETFHAGMGELLHWVLAFTQANNSAKTTAAWPASFPRPVSADLLFALHRNERHGPVGS